MNTDTQQIEIQLSKSKIALILIGSIGFVVAGLFFVMNPTSFVSTRFDDPLIIVIVGIASILFFGVCTLYAARKLTDNKPGLTINQNYITDNSNGVAAGKILWADIEKIGIVTIQNQRLIMIHVKNPEDYIARQKSGFKRKLMKINYSTYGTPISIASNSLKMSFDELFKLLTNYLNNKTT